MTTHSLGAALAETVQAVPGVAFLTPGVTDRLRSAPAGSRVGGASPAGVRISRAGGTGQLNVDVRIVTRTHTRALDVTRATRTAVTARLSAAHPAETAHITVTVTGTV